MVEVWVSSVALITHVVLRAVSGAGVYQAIGGVKGNASLYIAMKAHNARFVSGSHRCRFVLLCRPCPEQASPFSASSCAVRGVWSCVAGRSMS